MTKEPVFPFSKPKFSLKGRLKLPWEDDLVLLGVLLFFFSSPQALLRSLPGGGKGCEPPPPRPWLPAPLSQHHLQTERERAAGRGAGSGNMVGEEGPSSRCPPRQGKGGRAVREAPKGRETPQPVGALWGKLRPDARRVTVVKGCRLLRAPHLLMTCLFSCCLIAKKATEPKLPVNTGDAILQAFVDGSSKQWGAGSQASNHHPGEQQGHPPSSATWLFLTRWRSGEHVPVSPLAAAPCSLQVQMGFLSYGKVHTNAAFLQQKPVNYVAKPSIKLISDFELTGASPHSKLPQDPLRQPFAGLLSAWLLPFPSSQKPLWPGTTSTRQPVQAPLETLGSWRLIRHLKCIFHDK